MAKTNKKQRLKKKGASNKKIRSTTAQKARDSKKAIKKKVASKPKRRAETPSNKKSDVSTNTPRFWTGKMYYLSDDYPNQQDLFDDFKRDDLPEHDPETFDLIRGNIFVNVKAPASQPNEIIIFDIRKSTYWDQSFRGFLYPDNSVSGKVQQVASSGFEDYYFKGEYRRYRQNEIVLLGYFTYHDGSKDTIVFHLKRDKIAQ